MKDWNENARIVARQAIELGFTGPWLVVLPFVLATAAQAEGNIFFLEGEDTAAGRMVYQPYIEMDEEANLYVFKEFRASIHKPVEISHATIGGIDTKALDEDMAQVSWQTDLEAMENDTSAMTLARSKMIGTVEKIFEKLEQLSGRGPQGKEISGLLKAKHMLFTFHERHVPEELKERFSVERIFHIDGSRGITKQESFNILCGRAVRKVFRDENDALQVNWFKLPSPGDFPRQYPVEYFFRDQVRLPDYPLADVLHSLPLALSERGQFNALLKKLWSGNLETVPMKQAGKVKDFQLAARPELGDVEISDSSGKIITPGEIIRFGLKPTSDTKQKWSRKKGL